MYIITKMLTHAFLLTWYSAVILRFNEIQLDTTSSAVDVFEKDWTITDVAHGDQVDHPSHMTTNTTVQTYIHFQDTPHASMHACLTHNQKPIAGIIHFVNENQTWGIIKDKWIERPSIAFDPPETIILTKDVSIDNYDFTLSKDLFKDAKQVLEGNAKALIVNSELRTEHICALDLMYESVNGSFVEWQTGFRFNYSNDRHENGLFASTTTSRIWFKLALRMRSPFVQLCILVVAWFGLYLYPETGLVTIKRSETKIGLPKCLICILAFILVRNAISDHIFVTDFDGSKFNSNIFMVFFGQLVTTVYTGLWINKRTTPLFQTSISSISYVGSSLCLLIAVQHVSYPVIAIIKSLQMMAVLFVGRLIFRKHYSMMMYLQSLSLSGGVVICMLAKYSTPSDALNVFTGLLLGIFLFGTAAFSHWQTHLFVKYKTPPSEMMWAVSYCSTIFLGFILFVSGDLSYIIQFAFDHYMFAVWLVVLIIPTVLEQWFIQLVIKHYGASMYGMVITASEAFALVGHSIAKQEPLRGQIYAGLAMVIATMVIISRQKNNIMVQKYDKIPQKDPELGYDSMEEYDLESDHED